MIEPTCVVHRPVAAQVAVTIILELPVLGFAVAAGAEVPGKREKFKESEKREQLADTVLERCSAET